MKSLFAKSVLACFSMQCVCVIILRQATVSRADSANTLGELGTGIKPHEPKTSEDSSRILFVPKFSSLKLRFLSQIVFIWHG